MSEVTQTTTIKTGAGEKLGGTGTTIVKTESATSTPRGSVKDAGRVHVGGGMMRY